MTTEHLPAFPTDVPYTDGDGNHYTYQEDGMTLRDYFAAHAPREAINAISGTSIEDAAKFIGVTVEEYNYRKHAHLVDAKARYIYADAMLMARQEETPG